jgi:hypothetical protein
MMPGTTQLWQAGMDVMVVSPMAILNQVLKVQTLTFTQDRQSGTLTTLDLVVPWLLRDGVATAEAFPPPAATPPAPAETTTPPRTPAAGGGGQVRATWGRSPIRAPVANWVRLPGRR